MITYEVIKRLSEGLALIERQDHRGASTALWDRTKLRKHATCPATGRELWPGDTAYRPIGNQMYRYERLHRDVIEKDR